MYRCNNCNCDFEQLKVTSEYHPYGNGYASEQYLVCPHCESDDYERLQYCSECDEYYPADDMSKEKPDLCLSCEITRHAKNLVFN